MTNPLDIIRAARLPEITKEVVLAGHLLAEIEILEAEARRQEQGTRRMTGNPSQATRAKINELREEMQASVVTLRLRALPKTEWRKLLEQHPPRRGNKEDAAVGVNMSTFFDPLIKACIVDPELSDEDFDLLIQALNSGEYENLTSYVWGLNRSGVNVPKARAELEATLTSDDD